MVARTAKGSDRGTSGRATTGLGSKANPRPEAAAGGHAAYRWDMDERSAAGAARDRVTSSRRRALETVRRTTELVLLVIRQNKELATHPGHEQSAARRVAEGEQELRVLADQEARILAEIDEADAGQDAVHD